MDTVCVLAVVYSKYLGGKETRRRLENMIIYQFPATLNVEFHRNQHGLSDTGRVGVLKGNGRRRKSRQHLQIKRRKEGIDARLTEYSVKGTTITHKTEKICGTLSEQASS